MSNYLFSKTKSRNLIFSGLFNSFSNSSIKLKFVSSSEEEDSSHSLFPTLPRITPICWSLVSSVSTSESRMDERSSSFFSSYPLSSSSPIESCSN